MPLPGGASDKAGNRYELIWTVMCMIRVMKGEADAIYLEPPGDEGEGIEFSVASPSGTEYHQVKRQLTGRGVWSLSELNRRGVLDHFYQRLGDVTARCVFTSSHAAHPLDELADRARQAGSWEEFQQGFINSDEWAANFNELNDRWPSLSREDSYHRVSRIHVIPIGEMPLRESVEYALETQVADNPSNALSVLMDFALEQVHRELTSVDIWDFLQSRGFKKQTWARDQGVVDVISELNEAYRSGMLPVDIGGVTIPRGEVTKILEIFSDERSANTVLVSGKAGVGKTSVISQVLNSTKDLRWPVLTLRVDRLEAALTPSELGESIRLPASPVSVLAAVADEKDCLLVVDQLDSISLASGRNPEFFDCIGLLLNQAQQHSNMKVLVACRKFDIDNDYRIQELIRDGGIATEVAVGEFDETIVRSLVDRIGMDAGRLSSKQVELLSLPIHLKVLAESVSRNPNDSLEFQTARDLYDRFWDFKRSSLRGRIDAAELQRVVDLITDGMAQRQALFVPVGLLDDYAETVAVMVSENILVRDGSRVSFFHEGFFDYIFARWFVSRDLDLVSFILKQEQSLFIRSQVRQVLLYQRDLSSRIFSRSLREILANCSVRQHLKVISLLAPQSNGRSH